MAIRRDIGRFRDAEDGVILVFWGISLAVVLGLVAMSFDFGRLASTQSELQSYADHVALAAAGELDGKPDAITRAQSAAANLFTDSQTFGSGSQALTSANYTLDFYRSLPSSDTANLAAGLTTNPAQAVYARVVVSPKTVNFTFGAAFYGLTGLTPSNNVVSATAVAGFTQYACDITPMMFCIPHQGWDSGDPTVKGDLILLRSGGQGAGWGPGDFGFLDPSTLAIDSTGNCAGAGGTGPTMRCVLGAVGSVTQCFAQRGVDIEPGQKQGITSVALNVRFDMWSGAMGNLHGNAAYAPAANVLKGLNPNGGNACNWSNPQQSTDTAPLPLDDCFPGCGRYGDGNWSTGRTNYVAMNYGGADPHPGASTRYDYYQAEVAAAGGWASTSPILSGLSETGRRQCSVHQSTDPERRVFIAAGIDCTANPINGAATNVPVDQFVKMFITRPASDTAGVSNSMDLYAEVIGKAGGAGGGGAGIFHDVVQLYR